jgi:hypothetical protein
MRKFTAAAMMFGWVLCGGSAQADPLSGTQLKEKVSDTVLVLSKSGRKTNRRLEVTLNRDGTGASLTLPRKINVPVTWKVKGRDLCLTQKKDGKEFCMITQTDGDDVLVQMRTDDGAGRQLKGTITRR